MAGKSTITAHKRRNYIVFNLLNASWIRLTLNRNFFDNFAKKLSLYTLILFRMTSKTLKIWNTQSSEVKLLQKGNLFRHELYHNYTFLIAFINYMMF
jgi:hypothetical protein